MCGMAAYSGVNDFDPGKISQLMLANMTRGMHSTGMLNDGHITKLADNAIEFLSENKLVPERIFMGHDRHATIGNKTEVKNAHPFRYGTIVGQHNGTLKNHWELLRNADFKYADYDVDSQVLISLINNDKEGLKVLQEFEGAAAIIWHDTDHPNRLYCFRNSERPLYRGMFNKDMYISSIEKSLKLIGCDRIKEFKQDFVYAIEDGVIVLESSKRVPKKSKKSKKKDDLYKKALTNYWEREEEDYGNSGFRNNSINNNASINLMCNWVKCINERPGSKFKLDKWYEIHSQTEAMLVINESPTINITVPKDRFTSPEKLRVNGYVIVPSGDDKYFESGEVLFLRGLELSKSKKSTLAVLEKTTVDDAVYTWESKFIRNATQSEIDSVMLGESGKSAAEFQPNEKLSSIEKEMYVFQNDVSFEDSDGNRLGNLWIEVGSTYETLESVCQELDLIGVNIENIIDNEAMAPRVKDALTEIRRDLTEQYDVIDNESDELFDKAFELYKE